MKHAKGQVGATGSAVHQLSVYLIARRPPPETAHQSRRPPIDGARFILKTHGPRSGLSITRRHRLHDGGDELRRKAPLPVLEPGDREGGGEVVRGVGGKREDSACMYARAGSHKS